MISRVAVLPHPPLLVPELMGASVAGGEPMRTACLEAAARLCEVSPDWLVVGPAATTRSVGPDARGTFRGYGADIRVSLGAGDAGSLESLPLPALIAGWLRAQAGARGVRVETVAVDASDASCAELGRRLAATAPETALLVLGDGSNRRGARAPGGHDDRAEGFDVDVSGALATGDLEVLRALDPDLAGQLGVTGRAPWQVLAALAAGDGGWDGELLYSDAPFGVGYHVAVWDRA